MDIQLIKIDPVTRVVSLKMSTKKVVGISKLLQIVVLSLFNSPGKDILDLDRGAGIPDMIGMNLDPDDLTEVLSEVTRRIKNTEREILTEQIGLNIPPTEKLRELRLISVGPGANLGEVAVRVRIVNELGQRAEVVL